MRVGRPAGSNIWVASVASWWGALGFLGQFCPSCSVLLITLRLLHFSSVSFRILLLIDRQQTNTAWDKTGKHRRRPVLYKSAIMYSSALSLPPALHDIWHDYIQLTHTALFAILSAFCTAAEFSQGQDLHPHRGSLPSPHGSTELPCSPNLPLGFFMSENNN